MKPGEVVQLGPHRLLCGDAFNAEHVEALMQGEKPDMLYCDPPYGINLDTRYTKRPPATPTIHRPSLESGRVTSRDHPAVINDDVPLNPWVLIEQFRHAEQFWWGADYYRSRLPESGSWVVWDKRITEAVDRQWGSCFELCWSKNRHRREIARFVWSGILGQNGIDQHRYHPTQKPVKLAEWFLERYSKPGALVLDLFGGSGSTLLACERMGRRCYMAEIDPTYCGVIQGRYHALTKQPRLLEDSA